MFVYLFMFVYTLASCFSQKQKVVVQTIISLSIHIEIIIQILNFQNYLSTKLEILTSFQQ